MSSVYSTSFSFHTNNKHLLTTETTAHRGNTPARCSSGRSAAALSKWMASMPSARAAAQLAGLSSTKTTWLGVGVGLGLGFLVFRMRGVVLTTTAAKTTSSARRPTALRAAR